MSIVKLVWGIRAILYKPFLKEIGLPSYIGKPIYISSKKNISLGKRVRIYPGIRAELVDRNSSIRIGNNVSIGQNFHVVSFDDILKIGDNTTVAGNVFITNCDHDYQENNDSVLDSKLIYKKTEIGESCFIGNNAAILAGSIIGNHCVIGSNSVVKGKFEDYSVIVGAPAKVVKKFDKDMQKWRKV